MTWLPRHWPVLVYSRDLVGMWGWEPLGQAGWDALNKTDVRLSWALYDPCTAFTEETIRNEWATMGKRERQARYAEPKAARALRTEAKQAKALTI